MSLIMKCVIVGLGYFGKIIQSKLKEFPIDELITIDPFNTNSEFKNISDVKNVDGYWFVTTPASTHHSILLELFQKGVKNIWVEKPICNTLDDTLDIFSKKPDDVFLYCDFTWLQHQAIKRLGGVSDIKHIEMKWMNDGSMIPKDVNIVTDLAVHPISILTFLLIKSKDILEQINVTYANDMSVLINGFSKNGITFNIEVSNSSSIKTRNISVYCVDDVYRWFSEDPDHIENLGLIKSKDAIVSNIQLFFSKNSLGYPLDIARTLETVNELFTNFDK
jgi:predicted dehydrogenase